MQSKLLYWIDFLLIKIKKVKEVEKIVSDKENDEEPIDPELFLDDDMRAELFGYGMEDPDSVDLHSEDNDWQALLEESAGSTHEELPSFAFVYPEVLETTIEKPNFDICTFEELKVYARATEDPEALFLVALRYPINPNDPDYNQEYVQNPRHNEEMRFSYLRRAAAKGHKEAQMILNQAQKFSIQN